MCTHSLNFATKFFLWLILSPKFCILGGIFLWQAKISVGGKLSLHSAMMLLLLSFCDWCRSLIYAVAAHKLLHCNVARSTDNSQSLSGRLFLLLFSFSVAHFCMARHIASMAGYSQHLSAKIRLLYIISIKYKYRNVSMLKRAVAGIFQGLWFSAVRSQSWRDNSF